MLHRQVRLRRTSPSPRSRSTRPAPPRTRPCPAARTRRRRARLRHAARVAASDVGPKALERGHPHRRLAARTCRRSRSSCPRAGSARRWAGRAFRRSRSTRDALARCLGPDVAVAGLGAVGTMPSVTIAPLAASVHGVAHRAHESRRVGDRLIGRRHDEHRVAAALERVPARPASAPGPCCAPPARAAARVGGDVQLAQLVEQQETVLVVADHQRRGRRRCRRRRARPAAAPPAETGSSVRRARETASGKPRATAATAACRCRRP